jgi:medium-chain acyl-[acyl-carrier-protein] hydrolase
MQPGSANPWIFRPRPNPTAALRLLCFPYAGGGASVYRTWPAGLPADVELLAIAMPGRDARAKALAALVDGLAPVLDAPFAIYGHSLGAMLGFQLARELRRRQLPGPKHLFVSGRRAPQLPENWPTQHMSDPEFLAMLRQLGGIPDAVFQEAELMAYFLPIFRADFALSETAPSVQEPPLACPITALGGVSDDRAPLDELDAWQAQTTAGFEREVFPGGHFFLQSDRDLLLASLSRRLARITAAL